MKTVIELSLNPSHEKFAEMMRELNEVFDIFTRNTTLENAYKFFKMTEKFAEMMRELKEVVDILTRNTTLEGAYKFLKTTNFNFIEFGKGSSHIWVKFSYQGRLSERVLIATE